MHADPPPLLTLTGVSRSYGERLALCPVDLVLAAGRCVAVMGTNGSGTSTMLRIAAGRDAATTGRVSYAGRALAPAGFSSHANKITKTAWLTSPVDSMCW